MYIMADDGKPRRSERAEVKPQDALTHKGARGGCEDRVTASVMCEVARVLPLLRGTPDDALSSGATKLDAAAVERLARCNWSAAPCAPVYASLTLPSSTPVGYCETRWPGRRGRPAWLGDRGGDGGCAAPLAPGRQPAPQLVTIHTRMYGKRKDHLDNSFSLQRGSSGSGT